MPADRAGAPEIRNSSRIPIGYDAAMSSPPLYRLVLLVLALLASPGRGQAGPSTETGGGDADVDVVHDLVYSSAGGVSLTMSFYRPRTEGPHPAVVVIPGGAWREPFRWSSFAKKLAGQGIATAAIVTRLAPDHPYPAAIEDCRRAIQFVRIHAARLSVDPARVGAVGVSSGGHLALLLGTQDEAANPESKVPLERASTRPRCVVAFCAPTHLVPGPGRDTLSSDRQMELLGDFLGVTADAVRKREASALERGRVASPVRHATPDDPPTLLVHGTEDPIVPVNQARQMAAALEKAKVPLEYVEVPGGRHVDYLYDLAQGMGMFAPKAPHDAAGDIWKQTCAFLHRQLAPAPTSRPSRPRLSGRLHEVDVVRGIVFARRGAKELKLDLYRPDRPGPHPCMLVIHGGAWRMGSRALFDAPATARALAQEGIAAASIDHRLVPRFRHPAQIEDARTAMQFLRIGASRMDLDPDRIGAIGTSSGGHLAALLGTQDDARGGQDAPALERFSTRPRCVVAYSAPMDLVPAKEGRPTGTQVRIVGDFLGVDESTPPDVLRRKTMEASPLRHVTGDDAPMLLVHTTGDSIVPVDQARRMAARLEEAGVTHDYLEIDRRGHASFLRGLIGKRKPEFWKRTRAFLRTHLLD